MARYYIIYAAVVAVVVCAALQEVGCTKGRVSRSNSSKSTRNAVQEPSKTAKTRAHVEHHTCEVYKAPIWEKTFSNPIAMTLVKDSLLTLKEAATDEVCSNTIRSILKFGQTTLVNDDAHYSAGMFLKMLHRILQDIDYKSEIFKLTYKNVQRMFFDDIAHNLKLNLIVRIMDLMKNSKSRDRLFRLLLAAYAVAQPSKVAKQTAKNVKRSEVDCMKNWPKIPWSQSKSKPKQVPVQQPLKLAEPLVPIQKPLKLAESLVPVQEPLKLAEPWVPVEHHTCEVYKKPIWEKTFSNPIAMTLVKDSLLTLKEAATDEVCSNTIRSILKFGQTTLVNDDAHYSAGMFLKMLHRILQDFDYKSENFQLTYKNVQRMFFDDIARNLKLNLIVRIMDLMKDPKVRDRLFHLLFAAYAVAQPSKVAKQTAKNLKTSVSRTLFKKSNA